MSALEQPPLRGPDGVVLRAIKTIMRRGFLLLVAWRRRRDFSRWRLAGECNQCGECCERPSVMVDDLTWRVLPIRRAFLWWQRVVNGFELVSAERPGVFQFSCLYWDRAAKRCTSYDTRPAICRDYPRVLLEQSAPEFYKECGYRAVAANSKRLLRVLDRADLTPEKRDELKRRYRIE